MSDSNNLKYCKYCRESINPKAKICKYCGTNQNLFWRWVNNLNLIPLIISIVLLILSFLQFNEANKERITAENAKNIALNTKQQILKIENSISRDKQDVISMAKTIAYVSEILPKSTGYGGGMSKKMKHDLQIKLDSLNQILKKYKK